MSDSDDLRSRIEAQIAARRRGATGRHSRSASGHRRSNAPPADPSTERPSGPGPVSPVEATQVIASEPSTAPPSEPGPVSPVADTQVLQPVRPDQEAEPGRRHRRQRAHRLGFGFRLLVLVVAAGVLALCLRTFVVEPFWIPSESMEPTLHGCSGCNDDRLLVDKLSYKLHGVHRGDVVVFHRPPGISAAEKVLIKRVIGLGGETVSGHDSKVWIGNRPLVEPYVSPACSGTRDFARVTVPRGDVFVMGDNRCDSTDSRVFGPIRASSIIGRAFVIIWPLGRIHWL